MELTPSVCELILSAVALLTTPSRRQYMARVVRLLGRGGQRLAEEMLKFDRRTVRKGEHELRTGIVCYDGRAANTRKGVLDRLPNLEKDIRDIIACWSQTDPRFGTTLRYAMLSVEQVVVRLIQDKGYKPLELPSNETVRKLLHKFGFKLRHVRKAKPKKKIPETDAIFEQLHQEIASAAQLPSILRVCTDAKASVKIGELCRGGMSWVSVKALDHDFQPDTILTPIDILLPEHDELHLYFVEGIATADTYVDVLQHFWENNRQRFPEVDTLLINQDNGPEVNSRRTQYISRMVQFADSSGTRMHLAYYPPYHSKYNPAERPWARLEKWWNGSLLDTVEAAVGFASSMTWKGELSTVVEWFHKRYHKGVKLTKKAMEPFENRIERLPGLGKWFLEIAPASP